MPNLGGAEILVILLVALLVLGPEKLPGAARSVGRGLSHLRRLSGGIEAEIRNAMGEADDAARQGPSSRSPSSGSAGLHPGLGPGPSLGAGAVDLGGSATPTESTAPPSGESSPVVDGASVARVARPVVEGPDESFS